MVISNVDLARQLLEVIIENNEDYSGYVYININGKLHTLEEFYEAHGRIYAIVKETKNE